MAMRLLAENYRSFRKVDWEIPPGVSVVVGPNGSGKTTLLDLPELFRHAIERGMQKSVEHHGGVAWLRHKAAEPSAPVTVTFEVGEVRWELDLSAIAAGMRFPSVEKILVGGVEVANQSARDREVIGPLLGERELLLDLAEDAQNAVMPLVKVLDRYRFYRQYHTWSIRQNGSQHSSDDILHVSGRNVFSVLRNWRDRRETRPRWELVKNGLRRCFPDLFEDLDFDVAGQVITGRILAPGFDEGIPVHLAPEGWLVALLHLTAVASIDRGGMAAIDEPENGLHPYAIRGLIDVMRTWAADQDVRIVLATHAPVILDEFKEAPERVFVMERKAEKLPVRLDELRGRDWLMHFSLGDLYAHEEFGAQDPELA
ncbi:AAA family ATPase [Polyangium aurulentum]|uniref:AAA family ATPase n=1 Tax=Polyangium aurulentum TaxID=2567896 RepID=UPI0010AE7DDF|nr:AAA family ATPase [Polyangium aurulentum]UQA58808.1 AAA family ATPase [Polyangium aurulentum]